MEEVTSNVNCTVPTLPKGKHIVVRAPHCWPKLEVVMPLMSVLSGFIKRNLSFIFNKRTYPYDRVGANSAHLSKMCMVDYFILQWNLITLPIIEYIRFYDPLLSLS